jgi:hypothetical protein
LDAAAKNLGGLNLLVNCAGVIGAGRVGGQLLSVYVPADQQGDAPVSATHEHIDAVHEMVRRNPSAFSLTRTAAEVEKAIAKVSGFAAHVVGLPDPERGHVVAAVVALDEGAEFDEDALRESLKRELSSYKIPRRFASQTSARSSFAAGGRGVLSAAGPHTGAPIRPWKSASTRIQRFAASLGLGAAPSFEPGRARGAAVVTTTCTAGGGGVLPTPSPAPHDDLASCDCCDTLQPASEVSGTDDGPAVCDRCRWGECSHA